MIKIRYIIFLFLFIGSTFALFQIKFKVQQLNREVVELKQQLDREKNLIHVLKAEWAYLNQPERLQRLTEKFLDLVEMKPEQILIASGLNYADKAVENNNIIKASYTPSRRVTKWRYKDRPDLRLKR